MKPQYQILSLAVALALSPAAMAAGFIQATDLDEVIVTGTRTEVLLAEIGRASCRERV